MKISVTNTSGTVRSVSAYRRALLAGATLIAGAAIPGVAMAQDAPAPVMGETEPEEARIVVTGSRIARDGTQAPSPVSVISEAEVQIEAPANIADYVNTLPSVQGSTTAVTNSGSLSNGQSGISSLNLRSLGATRTLVLLDGQRSVGSTATNLVDINTFPQALIERVEVVTGGASSVYGSDAISGVVNFILDKDFTGVEANYQYGVTTYSDIPNHLVQLTAGTPFAGGRGHVVASAEYFTQKGQHTIDRDWNESGFFQIENPFSGPGQPELFVSDGIGSSNFTPGGMITSVLVPDGDDAGTGLDVRSNTPFRGAYFGTQDGAFPALGRLNFGEVSGQWMLGGDYDYASRGHRSSNSLANDEERMSLFGRIDYEFAPAFNVFAQASYSKFEGESFYQQTPTTNYTIQLDNAFLPPELLAEIDEFNATAAPEDQVQAIRIGTSNSGIPAAGGSNTREVERYVVGADGYFGIGGVELDWNAYYQHGATSTDELLINTWQNLRMDAQADAVDEGAFNGGDPNGNIVCRVNVDDNPGNNLPGCIPLNRIGENAASQEALDFLFQVLPQRNQFIKQDVAAINFSTDSLFETWAGGVGFGFGGEWRKDSVDGTVRDIPGTELYGNYAVTTGEVNVKEAYAEAIVPLGFGLEANGAVRVTDYSTSGTVVTWKAGAIWQPIDDIRFRATLSRDIRAPNLLELFDAGTARTNSVNIPIPGTDEFRAEEFIQNLTGNVNLDPEEADTLGLGVVFTPTFLDGFALSVDYFDIAIDGAIASVNAQQTVDLCFLQNQQNFCENIIYAPGSTTDVVRINQIPINFASQTSRGFDVEASYRMQVGPGDLLLRAFGTYTLENESDNGFNVNDQAGVNAGGVPTFVYRFNAGYSFDSGLSALIVARGFTDGVYDNDYIECAITCPATDPIRRTINNNHIDGTMYIDTNFTYAFDLGPTEAQLNFSVKNLFDRDPVLVGNGPSGNNTPAYPQTNRGLYDTFGRTFRLGIRVNY